jgi:tight adherence protein B
VNAAAALAFAAAGLGALALAEASHLLGRVIPGAAAKLAKLVDSVVRLGREGRDPGAAERRKLLVAASAAGLGAGTLVGGPRVGAALAAAGPWGLSRLLRAHRQRYRAAVQAGIPAAAEAIADALSGGHSLRGALMEAARSGGGAPGHELRRVAAELAMGARTEDALAAMRARSGSGAVDTLVAACLVQRRAGGNLAQLLRDCARTLEEQRRLEREVSAATAQARFTGLLVVLLPLGGALLAELASPGFLAGLWSSFLTTWLVGAALGLQLAAAVLIRRIARVRW